MEKKSKFAIAQQSHKSCYKLLQELPQDLKHKLTDTDGKSFIKWTIGGRWGFSYSVKAQLLPLNPDTTKVIIEASSDGIVDGLGVLSRSVQRLLKDFNTKVAKEIAHKESEQLFADVTPQ